MELLQTLVEYLASAAKAVWPGVLGAAAVGYVGFQLAGFPGFLLGSALGALIGTWIGSRLGLVPVRRMLGSPRADELLYALGAFIVVGVGYLLLQFALVIGAIIAIVAIAAAWLSG